MGKELECKDPIPDRPWSLSSALPSWYVAWKALAFKAIDGNDLEVQLEVVMAKNECLPSP